MPCWKISRSARAKRLRYGLCCILIFYPGRLVVSVRFGAITNPDAVKTYFGKIDKPEPEEGFARIDALHYDTKRQSTQDRLYFYLQLDWEGPLKIHCGKFSVSDAEVTTGGSFE